MVEPGHPQLSAARQCLLMGVSRSSYYYQSQPGDSEELMLMRLIDEQYTRTPFYGARRMTEHLRRLGHPIDRKRVGRLMRRMGLEPVYPRPKTSAPHPKHPIYPYLLRDVSIDHPNQVWAADITYIPLQKGFLYLVAVMDWYSRRVLSWRLSNTLDAHFCIDALEQALALHGEPEVFNTDQGSQFTSQAFTSILKNNEIPISMDGRGCYFDNIFVERLWRTVKYECVYLKAFDDGYALLTELKLWFPWYNHQRPHQALGYLTPVEAYFGLGRLSKAA